MLLFDGFPDRFTAGVCKILLAVEFNAHAAIYEDEFQGEAFRREFPILDFPCLAVTLPEGRSRKVEIIALLERCGGRLRGEMWE